MIKIAIDNGHGINTAGKRTPPFPNTGKVIREWEFNYATAKKLNVILKKNGFETLMVSDTTEDTPLSTRVNKANEWKADAFVSIHYNAFKSIWGSHGGIETFAHEKSTEGNKLAKLVQTHLIKNTKLRDRGIKNNSLYVTNKTKMPSILVECGFMDNLTEAALMLDENYQQLCAEAIAKGIMDYFGVKYTNNNNNNNSEVNVVKPDNKLPDWKRKQGETAINSLSKKKNKQGKPLLNDPEMWRKDLDKDIPSWLFWHMIDQITE